MFETKDEEENEIEKVFEEKLYISKKKPFSEISNIQNKKEPFFGNLNNEYDLKKLDKDKLKEELEEKLVEQRIVEENYELNEKYDLQDSIIDVNFKNQSNNNDNDVNFKNNTKNNDYINKIMKDNTKNNDDINKTINDDINNTIKDNTKKVNDYINNTIKNNTKNVNDDIKNNKGDERLKLHKLENEFQNLIKTHKNTLQIKSKTYRFIFNEIYNIRTELTDKIQALEKENATLKKEVTFLRGKLEDVSEYLKKYQKKIIERAMLWKEGVENKVKNYLRLNKSL